MEGELFANQSAEVPCSGLDVEAISMRLIAHARAQRKLPLRLGCAQSGKMQVDGPTFRGDIGSCLSCSDLKRFEIVNTPRHRA
jgi:hypothetical protein